MGVISQRSGTSHTMFSIFSGGPMKHPVETLEKVMQNVGKGRKGRVSWVPSGATSR